MAMGAVGSEHPTSPAIPIKQKLAEWLPNQNAPNAPFDKARNRRRVNNRARE